MIEVPVMYEIQGHWVQMDYIVVFRGSIVRSYRVEKFRGPGLKKIKKATPAGVEPPTSAILHKPA